MAVYTEVYSSANEMYELSEKKDVLKYTVKRNGKNNETSYNRSDLEPSKDKFDKVGEGRDYIVEAQYDESSCGGRLPRYLRISEKKNRNRWIYYR